MCYLKIFCCSSKNIQNTCMLNIWIVCVLYLLELLIEPWKIFMQVKLGTESEKCGIFFLSKRAKTPMNYIKKSWPKVLMRGEIYIVEQKCFSLWNLARYLLFARIFQEFCYLREPWKISIISKKRIFLQLGLGHLFLYHSRFGKNLFSHIRG